MTKKIEPASPVTISKAPNALSKYRRRVQLHTGPGLTEQAHKDDCDINQIVEKYSSDELNMLRTGKDGVYGDFTQAGKYQEATETLRHANERFESLPSQVRAAFDNDPRRFLAFVEEPRNKKYLVELGLGTLADKDPIESLTEALKETSSALKGKDFKKSLPAGGPKGEDDT
nr:MAG: internal scaffolding protein [Microvirus sp.]